jgi:transcriptional regulator with XRE-family HTH domain
MKESGRPQPALGLAIHQLRIKRGAKQTDIAASTGLTVRFISHVETGKANPSWATLQDIAGALEVSMVELAKLTEKLKAEGKDKPARSAR